jgi:hypothetical protein
MARRKRGNPNLVARRPRVVAGKVASASPASSTPAPAALVRHQPQREVIEIHTTTERKRNAGAAGGVFGNSRTNKLLLMGGAIAGGGATLIVADPDAPRCNGSLEAGDSVMVTTSWRYASWVELAQEHLRVPIFARFYATESA